MESARLRFLASLALSSREGEFTPPRTHIVESSTKTLIIFFFYYLLTVHSQQLSTIYWVKKSQTLFGGMDFAVTDSLNTIAYSNHTND